MSDFSELCPLFNTGVFGEVVFPGPMSFSVVTTAKNLLAGTGFISNAAITLFTFGRTVVITEAFVRRNLTNNTSETTIHLRLKTSATAACSGSIFASCTLPITGSAHEGKHFYKAFTSFSGKTFTSSDILGMCVVSTGNDTGEIGELIVRYREK